MCGSCRKCITACPSGCITDNHYIDASKCNAYLTIEYKGVVPRELRPNLGNWIYGCDICQNVCPHNISAQKKIPPMKTIFSQKVNAYVDLIKELQITPGEFQEKYEQTSVLRATHDGFRRNILIAMGNSGNADCIPALKEVLLSDPSWELRLQAAWALGQIGTQAGMLILEGVLEREQDQRVKEEAYFSLKIDK
jgi:epoxyqueuosine reductase